MAFVPHQWSDPAVCRVLIDAGADLQITDEEGCSPLHSACESGALDVVKMLVEAGAEVRATNDEGDTSFSRAAAHGHTDTVRYLLGLPDVDVNHGNFNALQCAAINEYPDVVQVLIDAGADIDIKDDFDGCSLLHYTCASGSLEGVKMLVRAGAEVRATNDEGEMCLVLAARNGHIETVRYLVCLPEVDVNYRQTDNYTALHCAVDEKPRTDVVQVLIDAGADIDAKNNEGCSPLHTVCASGALDVVKMLVEAGAGVRATNGRGETCLVLAARCGHTETVRYLVDLPEVDVNHVNRRYAGNYTALQCALEGEKTDAVQVLIDAGADVVTNNNALHSACVSGTLDIVKMLVRAGAGVRATNEEGWTCLITVAFFGHIELVRYLVGLPEVELNHRDTAKNYTALHYAVEQKHTEVAQVLTDALLFSLRQQTLV